MASKKKKYEKEHHLKQETNRQGKIRKSRKVFAFSCSKHLNKSLKIKLCI